MHKANPRIVLKSTIQIKEVIIKGTGDVDTTLVEAVLSNLPVFLQKSLYLLEIRYQIAI